MNTFSGNCQSRFWARGVGCSVGDEGCPTKMLPAGEFRMKAGVHPATVPPEVCHLMPPTEAHWTIEPVACCITLVTAILSAPEERGETLAIVAWGMISGA